MVKNLLKRFLIWAIEGINNVIGYFEHDVKRGDSRKTISVAVILIAVMALSFVGASVTGQVTRARESASVLSEKLGSAEAKYQSLSVENEELSAQNLQCKSDLEKTTNEFNVCKTDLSVKSTDYDTTKEKYDKCVSDFNTRTTDYNTCTSDLTTRTTQLNDKTSAYNTLNTNYNALVAKNNAIIVNTVIDRCCTLTSAATVSYKVTADNHIECFVSEETKEGTVNCP